MDTPVPSGPSTLHGASVDAEGNEFNSVGRNMYKVNMQNVMFNVTTGVGPAGADTRDEDKTDAPSNSIVGAYSMISTLLDAIFRRSEAIEIDPRPPVRLDPVSVVDPGTTDLDASHEAVIEYIDSCTILPSTSSGSAEKYTRSMLDYGEGYPLYEPEPDSGAPSEYCREGIRVGDVGLVTENGSFDFLFNVCPSRNTSINPADLPADFEMLESIAVSERRHFPTETHLFSGVSRGEEPEVNYKCLGSDGAILELPIGATRMETQNKLAFKALAARQAEKWYRYTLLTRWRDAPNGSLYLVTSAIKCTKWGIAVFIRPSSPQDYLRFIVNDNLSNNRQGPYYWKGSGAYVAKVAPIATPEDDQNQCVFLRGYKIMLPKDMWANLANLQIFGTSYPTNSTPSHNATTQNTRQIGSSNRQSGTGRGTLGTSGPSTARPTHAAGDAGSAASRGDSMTSSHGHHQHTPRPNVESLSGSFTASERIILEDLHTASLVHPSDLINVVLLEQEPDAKVALTHDDDWRSLMQDYQALATISENDRLSKIAMSYRTLVDKQGSVCLERISDTHADTGTLTKAPSPLRKTSTTPNHWREEGEREMAPSSPSSLWTQFETNRATSMQEIEPGWQRIRDRVMKAVQSVLGATVDDAHHSSSAEMESTPLPGLAPAATMLLKIWEALGTIDMSRIACFRLTERCAEILLSVREEIHEAGDEIGDDLSTPIIKLIDSFSLVYNLFQKMNRRPFLKRYLERNDMLRQIAETDESLTNTVGMFNVPVQLRIFKQVQAAEKARERDHDAFLFHTDHAIDSGSLENTLRLTGVGDTTPLASSSAAQHLPSHFLMRSSSDSLLPAGVPADERTPITVITVNDETCDDAGVIRPLRELQTRQNTLDAAKDLADLRQRISVALQTSNDTQILELLQIGRDDIPEAIKTLQRALEKITERDSAPRFPAIGYNTPRVPWTKTRKAFKGPAAAFTPSKRASRTDSKAMDYWSARIRRRRDVVDREFIEGGLDALRRLSQGVKMTLPSWTITRYEVDREEKIGVGVFSNVYKGKWRGRTVAIRILVDTTPRELFVKVTEIWKSLHHPNVLKLYGASSATSDPPWFFVTPYKKNGSLPMYLRRVALEFGASTPLQSQSSGLGHSSGSPMSIGKSNFSPGYLLRNTFTGYMDRRLNIAEVPRELNLYRFMYEIARGMQYLHNMNVLHGNLKAANVLIDEQCHCIISDFGLSEMKSEIYRKIGMSLPHSLRWQAPELTQNAPILTCAMDVYAFAICCVEIMLLGRIPWPSNDDLGVRHLVLFENKRPSIPDIPPFNSVMLRELIGKCWDKVPVKRPTFSEIVKEIRFIRKKAGQSVDKVPSTLFKLPDEHQRYSPSPHMRPSALPTTLRCSSEEFVSDHHQECHQEDTFYPVSELSPRSSSVFTHAASSTDSFLISHHGYESPVSCDEQALERKHERRYRLFVVHDFHPSLTLPLWEPSPIKLGAVGYLSKPSGSFVTLFNSFSPFQASNEEARKLPSLHAYGKVESGMQKQHKRNAVQRNLDMITGLLAFGDGRKVSRRYSFPLRSGYKTAYLCTETTMYRYLTSLDTPKRWFTDNVDRIMKIYAPDHPITREDVFLVVGTLDSPDHALFVSHKHSDGQVHFDVYAVPRNGQSWGTFTIDTFPSPKLGGPLEGPQYVNPASATRVSNTGEGWKTVILARLRFKPDSAEPTSL